MRQSARIDDRLEDLRVAKRYLDAAAADRNSAVPAQLAEPIVEERNRVIAGLERLQKPPTDKPGN